MKNYSHRSELAEKLKSATGNKAEKEMIDFVARNFKAIMEADLPEDEKDFLSEVAEIKGGDLEDEINEYEMAYHGLESDDLLGYAEKFDGGEEDVG